MKTGAGALSYCIEAFDGRLSVQVYEDTAAKIVGCRSYRNVIFGDVDAQAEAFLVNIGKVLLCLFRVFVSDIEINMVIAPVFHFVIDCPRDDVAWSQRKARIVFLHELFAVECSQYGSVSPHGLGDEERRAIAGVI